eukprot:g1284.t1
MMGKGSYNSIQMMFPRWCRPSGGTAMAGRGAGSDFHSKYIPVDGKRFSSQTKILFVCHILYRIAQSKETFNVEVQTFNVEVQNEDGQSNDNSPESEDGQSNDNSPEAVVLVELEINLDFDVEGYLLAQVRSYPFVLPGGPNADLPCADQPPARAHQSPLRLTVPVGVKLPSSSPPPLPPSPPSTSAWLSLLLSSTYLSALSTSSFFSLCARSALTAVSPGQNGNSFAYGLWNEILYSPSMCVNVSIGEEAEEEKEQEEGGRRRSTGNKAGRVLTQTEHDNAQPHSSVYLNLSYSSLHFASGIVYAFGPEHVARSDDGNTSGDWSNVTVRTTLTLPVMSGTYWSAG